ncbi:putative polypeptide N-acetylgalactosaminyltransferase 9, partial [Littorina saxatilis]|uniref:putative polypeptide N-acetylgalactosaminyltransferase 9 n=1 Tax=Littorina saxatilis TaxID=31220 RepID=UPI0038B64C90
MDIHSLTSHTNPFFTQKIHYPTKPVLAEHLKTPLDQYVSHLPKVSVIRSPTREGLIKARLLGLSHVTARVVVFLDSHCECAQGWLEPLLERIYKDPTNVVVPIIDAINDETFQFNYASAKYANVGTFNWALMFNWMQIQPGELARRKSIVEPIRTPTMAGGLFAIDRDYFYKLGTYDPGMKIWGGENLELSFKIWMCGGTLETAPCSHVGHVFRNTSPHSSGGYRNYLSTNINRLTAVWLDEYSFYSNRARRVRQSDVNVGDIAERLELRRRLKCHSFGWYMKHVMPEKYLPADRVAHGA